MTEKKDIFCFLQTQQYAILQQEHFCVGRVPSQIALCPWYVRGGGAGGAVAQSPGTLSTEVGR